MDMKRSFTALGASPTLEDINTRSPHEDVGSSLSVVKRTTTSDSVGPSMAKRSTTDSTQQDSPRGSMIIDIGSELSFMPDQLEIERRATITEELSKTEHR